MNLVEVKNDVFSMCIFGNAEEKCYGLGKDFEKNGCHEPIVSKYLYKYIKNNPKAVFWDIGAGKGYFSIIARVASIDCEIHAFEPSNYALEYLKANNAMFADDSIFINAIKLGEDILADDYANKLGFPDIIKIDIDGGEDVLIPTMTNILARNPVLLIEVHFKGDYVSRRALLNKVLENYSKKVCLNHSDINGRWIECDIPKHGYVGDYVLLCEYYVGGDK